MLLPFFSTLPLTTETHTLSLHDALPISLDGVQLFDSERLPELRRQFNETLSDAQANRACLEFLKGALKLPPREPDRKSTRLNSSHVSISYAVFCLKKKKHPHIFLDVFIP